jgi:hypothetical protein
MAPPQPLLRRSGGWTRLRLSTASLYHGCPGWGVGDRVCRLHCLYPGSWRAASAWRLGRLDRAASCVRFQPVDGHCFHLVAHRQLETLVSAADY